MAFLIKSHRTNIFKKIYISDRVLILQMQSKTPPYKRIYQQNQIMKDDKEIFMKNRNIIS